MAWARESAQACDLQIERFGNQKSQVTDTSALKSLRFTPPVTAELYWSISVSLRFIVSVRGCSTPVSA